MIIGKKSIVVSALSLSCVSAVAIEDNAVERPNILIVFLDEMRFDALGYAGNSIVKTPNLDKLASQSVVFDNAYTVSPLSCPARKSFFTGRYPHVHGVILNDIPANDGEIDLPIILRHYGYVTAIAGKLHYTPKNYDWGFDYFWTYHRDEGPMVLETYNQYIRRMHPKNFRALKGPYQSDPLGRDLGKYEFPVKDFESNWITDRSIEFLNKYHESDCKRPFFLFTSISEPHSPYKLCEPYASMYNPKDIPVPEVNPKLAQERIEVLKADPNSRRARQLAGSSEMTQALTAAYYGHVTNVDDNIGRLLSELKRLGYDENTIVVFTADHGNMLGDKGRWFKSVMYEGSSHIPMFIKMPENGKYEYRVKAQGHVSEIVELIDVMPTLLEAALLPIPEGIQGKSLMGLMAGDSIGWKNRAFSELTTKMLREGNYKLIVKGKQDDQFELYDISKDPQEKNDLSRDSTYNDLIYEMKKRIDKWQSDIPSPVIIEGLQLPEYYYKINF